MSNAPAGWYSDPAAVGVTPPPLRYWDGNAWTHHTAPAPQPAYPQPYGQQYGQAQPYGQTQQYARPQRVWATTPDGVRLAGWWHRVGASLLDQIFTAIVSVIFTLPAQISMQNRTQSLEDEFRRRVDDNDPHAFSWFFHQIMDLYRDHAWEYLVPVVIVWVAMTCFTHLLGGSPGQLLTGLRVRLRSGPGNLSWGSAAMRALLYPLASSLLLVLALISGSVAVLAVFYAVAVVWGLLDPLWAAWDAKKQTLHDKIVATNVVRTR